MNTRVAISLMGFFFFIVSGIAQEGPYQGSGKGMIGLGADNVYPGVNFPMAEITLYTAAGERAGVIYRKDMLNLMYLLANDSKAYRISNEDLVRISMIGYCLKFYDRKSDYLRVLMHTADEGYWIYLKDISYFGFNAIPWLELFLARKTGLYSRVDVGINLREGPDQQTGKLTLVKGRNYLISLTGKTNGLWAEVHVARYRKHLSVAEAAGMKPEEEWNGWMKVIDDAGYPNLWFSPDERK